MQKSYCIICGNEREGIEIREDHVIKAVKWFKTNITKNEKNNRLVVCRECYPKYEKARRRYQSRRITYTVLGIIFAAISLIVSPRLETLAMAVLVIALLYALSYLSYTPQLSIRVDRHSRGTPRDK